MSKKGNCLFTSVSIVNSIFGCFVLRMSLSFLALSNSSLSSINAITSSIYLAHKSTSCSIITAILSFLWRYRYVTVTVLRGFVNHRYHYHNRYRCHYHYRYLKLTVTVTIIATVILIKTLPSP